MHKNDDKLFACTADIVIDVIEMMVVDDGGVVMMMSMRILLEWIAPTLLNATTAAARVQVPILLLLQALRDAFHPCIGCRLALCNKEA